MATLAIDFDGVIHNDKEPVEGKTLGLPIEGAKEALRKLKNEDGHKIIIFSVKPPNVIEDWMRHFDIPYDRITTLKPEADLYIDDKALRFFTWSLTLASIVYNLPEAVGGKKNK